MTELETQLRRIAEALTSEDCRYALVGGLAVSIRAEPRMTRDADLVVSVTDDNEAEALIKSLGLRGYAILAAIEQEATDRLATVRLSTGAQGVVTDLLFASSGVEPEIVELAEPMEVLPDLVLPVARIGHLIAMKLLARDDRNRPNDADDLRALSSIATDEDWNVASTAVELIESRGYARGRNLSASLVALRRDGAY